jgi:2-polyprenyl-3-methyl-5-hydroxy-6-metoxy-1,4-benzoquinol methylase
MQSRKYEQRRLRLMASHVRGRDVLDLGYAQSPNPALAQYRTVGFDLAPVPAARAGYAEHVQGDVQKLATHLDGRRFDTVVCGELIEHLEEPYAFLRSVHEVLRPGGRLVLSTPNAVGFPTLLFELSSSQRRFYTRDHRFYFTPRWVERMLDVTGWRLTDVQAVGWWLPFGVVAKCPVACSYQVVYVAEAA